MKLHLPTGLLVAVMAAVCGTSTLSAADQKYENESTTKEFTTPTTWEGTESEKVSYSSNQKDNISSPYAGAMELNPSIKPFILEIKGYGEVAFDYNVMTGANVYGGAIHFESSYYGPSTATLMITGNKAVSFVGNQGGADANAGPVAGTSPNVYGGAMYVNNNGSANIVKNETVTITDNSANGVDNASGGAMYATGSAPSGAVSLKISGNTGGVKFERNKAETEKGYAYGGAIYEGSSSSLELNDNKVELLFSENIAKTAGTGAMGGAIATYGTTSIQGNEKVTFKDNAAISTDVLTESSYLGNYKIWGGAIYSTNAVFSICGNGDVSFEGNYVQNDSISWDATTTTPKLPLMAGGAIYAQKGMTLQNNGDVLFAGNYEKATEGYRLRALYVQGGNTVFSAKEGKKIEFQDAITVCTDMKLNAPYCETDQTGTIIETAQTGTIIMTGANTKTLLEGLKGEGNVSDAEIAKSQSFEVKGKTTLYGGTLKVEDSANYVGGGFATADKANATVELKEATFDHGTKEVAITSGSSLVVNNSATLNAGTLTMAAGSTLTFNALVDASTIEQGVLGGTIGTATIGGTVNVALSFDSSYLQTLTEETTALTIKLMDATTLSDNYKEGSLTYEGLDSRVWTWDDEDLALKVDDNGLYVTGSLTRNEDVVVEGGGEIDSPIAGDTDVTLGGNVTISGDNSHTGDTVIKGASGSTDNTANVTLGSDNALGSSNVIVDAGVKATIGTASDVTAELPGSIENNGKLTIKGTYSADADTLETTDIASTHLCVDNKEGNNGFLREGATGLVVVDNKDGGELTVGAGTTLTVDGTTYALSTSGNALQVDYSTYHINEDGHEASFSKIKNISKSNGTQDVAVQMKGGTLLADTDVTNLEATGGTIFVRESNPSTPLEVEVDGNIAGDTKVEVTGVAAKAVVSGKLSGDASVEVSDGAEVTISGTENTQTGAVVINNATLKVGDDATLGNSIVHLENQGKLDLNNQAVSNYINVTGCTLCNASQYEGNVDVSGDLSLDGNANANMVTLVGSGNIRPLAGETLTVGTLVVAAGAAHSDQISAATTVRTSIVLNGGSVLTMSGTLTLQDGTTITLQGRGYHADQDIVTAGAGSALDTQNFTVKYYGQVRYEVTDTTITLLSVFDQRYADLFTVGNWGHATASRAFVNAVRGQRTNTGCIANGRGTAWAALLGGYHDIAGSDIDLKGAAMGVDVKLGEKSSVGVALGYVENDTKPTGWSTLDQTGTYIALYGEHGLKKLSSTSCLSLDWVVAYGQGESEIDSTSWEQDSLQLNSRLSWNKKLSERLCLSVFGGLEYYTNESDTVDGMKTGSIQNLRGELGVGASYVVWGVPGSETVTDEKGAEIATTGTGCRRLVVHGELRYMNDMVRSNPVIRMDGLSGTGENPGRSGIGIEAGATYRFNDRWSASANYGFNALDDSREHRVNVGASYTF